MPLKVQQTGLPGAKEFAAELHRLAKRPALALRRTELRLLADNLEKGRRLDRWAELDLVNAFVRPESLTVPAPPRSASVLGRLRRHPGREHALEITLGAMIFVPLLVTWFGLWEAIRAYGELTRQNPREANRPFLQLWQSGFDGHLPDLARFENVALTAALIISALVLLSVLHMRTRAQIERTETIRRAEDTRLLGELAAVLTKVQLELVPHRTVSPDRFTRVLTKAAGKLNDAIAESEAGQRQLADTVLSTGKTTEELSRATIVLKEAADRIEGAAEAAARAAKDTSVAALGAADSFGETAGTLGTALGHLATSQQALTDRSQSVADAAERAAQALVDSGDKTDHAVTGMLAATDRWDAAAAHWEDAAARVDSGLRALMDRLSVPEGADNGAVPRADTGADQ